MLLTTTACCRPLKLHMSACCNGFSRPLPPLISTRSYRLLLLAVTTLLPAATDFLLPATAVSFCSLPRLVSVHCRSLVLFASAARCSLLPQSICCFLPPLVAARRDRVLLLAAAASFRTPPSFGSARSRSSLLLSDRSFGSARNRCHCLLLLAAALVFPRFYRFPACAPCFCLLPPLVRIRRLCLFSSIPRFSSSLILFPACCLRLCFLIAISCFARCHHLLMTAGAARCCSLSPSLLLAVGACCCLLSLLLCPHCRGVWQHTATTSMLPAAAKLFLLLTPPVAALSRRLSPLAVVDCFCSLLSLVSCR